MGTNSLTSEQNSFFLLDDDNLSLYYGLMSNKSEVEEEEQSLDNIKNVFISEKTENKRPKSNISGDESLKVPITFEWDGFLKLETIFFNEKRRQRKIYFESYFT